MIDWHIQAKRILKSEMVRRGVSNESLAARLNQDGGNETKASIASKISRGTFSAAFFLHALQAMGCEQFELTAPKRPLVEEVV